MPMAGHLGIKRTADRLTQSFYWPGFDGDVQRYCPSCDTCQRHASVKVKRGPLQSIPIVSTPFSKVAVDIIGPLKPTSGRGHRYVLTIIDYETRYAEAVPLQQVDTALVAEALSMVWTRVGVPDEIVHDCGRQYISDVMKQGEMLQGVTSIHTTPYHPQSNRLIELNSSIGHSRT